MQSLKTKDNCVLCDKGGCLSEGNTEYLKKASEIFRMNVDFNKTLALICKNCEEIVDTSYNWYTSCKSSIKEKTNVEQVHSNTIAEHLIIANHLPKQITEKDLMSIFSHYGAIKDLDFLNESRNWEYSARITFSNTEDIARVMTAAEHREIQFNSEPLIVSDMSGGVAPIDMLPDECLTLIFQEIDYGCHRLKCEEVNNRWNRVARSSWSDYKHHVDEFDEEYNPVLESILSRCGEKLTGFTLFFNAYTEPYLDMIAQSCHNLENFQMVCFNALPVGCIDDLMNIFENAPKLRRFMLDGYIKNLQYSDDFNDCFDLLSNGLLELVLNGMQSMTASLDLSRFTNLVSLTLTKYTFDENALHGIEHLTKLQRLSLAESRTHSSNIRKITHFTDLISLEIPECQIDDETLTELVQNNRKLEMLDISFNCRITNRSFKLVTRLPSLDTLYMKCVSNVTGRYLKNMTKLESIVCTSCDEVKTSKLLKLILSSPKLNHIEAPNKVTKNLVSKLMRKLKSTSDRDRLTMYVNERVYRQCKELSGEKNENIVELWKSSATDDYYGGLSDIFRWWGECYP